MQEILRTVLKQHLWKPVVRIMISCNVKNEQIVAEIIAYNRQAVLKAPIYNHEERVKAAFSKLISESHFNKMQLDLLEKIKNYMLYESILNEETFDAQYLKWMVDFQDLIRNLQESSMRFIGQINTYLYKGVV